MRKFLILISLFAGFASTATLVSAQPVAPVPVEAITAEEQAALAALMDALAAATTIAEKQQILVDAIAETPSLATKTALFSSVQSSAMLSGLSIAQVDSAATTGLSQAATQVSTSVVVQSSSIAEEESLEEFIEDVFDDLTEEEIEELEETFADLGVDVEVSAATP